MSFGTGREFRDGPILPPYVKDKETTAKGCEVPCEGHTAMQRTEPGPGPSLRACSPCHGFGKTREAPDFIKETSIAVLHEL